MIQTDGQSVEARAGCPTSLVEEGVTNGVAGNLAILVKLTRLTASVSNTVTRGQRDTRNNRPKDDTKCEPRSKTRITRRANWGSSRNAVLKCTTDRGPTKKVWKENKFFQGESWDLVEPTLRIHTCRHYNRPSISDSNEKASHTLGSYRLVTAPWNCTGGQQNEVSSMQQMLPCLGSSQQVSFLTSQQVPSLQQPALPSIITFGFSKAEIRGTRRSTKRIMYWDAQK